MEEGSQSNGKSVVGRCIGGEEKELNHNPIKTHQNPSEPIKTHQNPSESIKTHQNPSEPGENSNVLEKNHKR